jgi:hypothetical protein
VAEVAGDAGFDDDASGVGFFFCFFFLFLLFLFFFLLLLLLIVAGEILGLVDSYGSFSWHSDLRFVYGMV